LACTVRACAKGLVREERAFVCAAGHAFDVARSGYVNLLQPHDKHSHTPGDSMEVVRARRTLLDGGFGNVLKTALVGAVEGAALKEPFAVADLGSGEGTFLAAIRDRFECVAFGVDISVQAVEASAKRHAGVTWIVANADRRLPLEDGSVGLVVSIDGRRNAAECARVLGRDGVMIVAVPAQDDLFELRESVLGEAHAVDRAATVEAEFVADFVLEERVVARDRRQLNAQQLNDLALATYRWGRNDEKRMLATIDSLAVTTSHDVLRFRRR